jgi:amidase
MPDQVSAICYLGLRELVRLLRIRQLSAREVMTAHLEQIRRWNPRLNAIVAKLSDETCLALAPEADARAARGEPLGGVGNRRPPNAGPALWGA